MIVLIGSQSKGSRSTERELYPKQVKFLIAEMRREARCPWPMLRKRVRVRIPSGRPSKQTCFLQKQKTGLLLFRKENSTKLRIESSVKPKYKHQKSRMLDFWCFLNLTPNIRNFFRLRKRG